MRIILWVSVLFCMAGWAWSGEAGEAGSRAAASQWLAYTRYDVTWSITVSGSGNMVLSEGNATYQYGFNASASSSFTLDVDQTSQPGKYICLKPASGTGSYLMDSKEIYGAGSYNIYHQECGKDAAEHSPGDSSAALWIDTEANNYWFQGPSLAVKPGIFTETMYNSNGEQTGTFTIPYEQTLLPGDMSNPGYATQRWPLPEPGLPITDSTSFSTKIYSLPDVPDPDTPPLDVTVKWTITPKDDVTIEISKLEQKPKSPLSSATDMLYKNGKLTLYAEATVKPEKFAKYVDWDVPSFGDAAPAKIQKKFRKGIASVRVTYNRMPSNNDGFGEKKLKATMEDFGLEAEETLRVFYKRDKKDNPEKETPNWYFYWKQGAVTNLGNFTYDEKMAGGSYNWETGEMKIGKDAPARSFGGITLNLTSKDGDHSCTLDRDSVKSINAVAAIVTHELTHKRLVESAKLIGDSDGDKIGDLDEPENPWTSWNDPNTYGLNVDQFYEGGAEAWADAGKTKRERDRRHKEIEDAKYQFDNFGDNELKAQMSEKARVRDTSKDWAYPGSQAGGE